MTRRRARKNKRWIFLKFVFFFCLAIEVFTLIWLRTAVVNFEYGLAEFNKQKASLIRERKLVTAQRAKIYSARNIEEIAIKQLGMRLPERRNIFFVRRTTGASPYRVSFSE